MSKLTKAQQTERDEARGMLLKILSPGDTVYTIVRHVSRSGMQREISLFVASINRRAATCYARDEHRGESGECPQCGEWCKDADCMRPTLESIDHLVATALGYRRGNSGGIVVGGCGMDMAYHLVYNLGSRLWPNGTPTPHGSRNGQPDSSGGYALKQGAL